MSTSKRRQVPFPPQLHPASPGANGQAVQRPRSQYKWVALSNTTLGVFMAFANTNIVLIAMPAIFQGIHINPLEPAETNYFLWLLLGYMVVTSTLLVTCGRISDMYGRVRLYNLGFAIFTLGSVLLTLTSGTGNAAALQLVLYRLVQGLGAAFLFSNSTAILTDAFPPNQRGAAMGFNQVAGILGSVVGLVAGGLLATISWRLVFLISVPIGLFGTVWAYLRLCEIATIRPGQKIDWAGNLTFAAGLTVFLLGVTYGIQPYGKSTMGWTNPYVVGALVVGAALLAAFLWIEWRSSNPMFRLELFRSRMFAMGNLSNFLASVARGGLQFMLIIWLQGIWLPIHGYRFEDTPLWAGIYMTPMLGGFLIMGPLSGWISDRIGSRLPATLGMIINALGFLGLTWLPADFSYGWFALLLVVLGVGQGAFVAPNTAAIMNSLPPEHRGVGSGMRSTLQNSAMMLSIGLFFSIVIAGLSQSLPGSLSEGLARAGLPATEANRISQLPPTSALFAAFLGYNPMGTMLPPSVLKQLPAASQQHLLGSQFFPQLVAQPFQRGLNLAFYLSAAMCFVAATASMFRGKHVAFKHADQVAAEAESQRIVSAQESCGDHYDF